MQNADNRARSRVLAVLVLVTLLGFLPGLAIAVDSETAGAEPPTIEQHVKFLAAPALEGRMTGSEGALSAVDYLSRQLADLGAKPLAGEEDLILEYDFTAGTEDAGSSITLTSEQGETTWTNVEAIQALSFSDNARVTGPVVFAGYGMTVPESDDFSYDSYQTLDVEDKIVVALRYFPEDAEQETRGRLARYSGLRYKALQARQSGAKALILVTGPRSPNAGEVIPMTFDTAVAGSGIVAASVNGEIGRELFSHIEDKDLESAQKSFDDANPHVVGFDIPGVEITLDVKVEREKRVGRNVVGVLGPIETGPPYVVVGAHFDHLGDGRHGNSLAKKEEAGATHHGADDNASGVAAALETARRLASSELRHPVVISFWSGEELGLLGSTDFVSDEKFAAEAIAAYINFDMVGRMRDNRLSVQAVGSSEVWPQLIEQANVPIGFDLDLQQDPYLPTDSSAFDQKDIPSLNFFTGSHEDYHRPSDTADKINYEDLDRIAAFGALIARKVSALEEPLQFVRVERQRESGGGRDTLRAYTGTIPDYATEVDGLRLSGVIEGGPADEAGLQEGDIVVEFAGLEIANIYDYTYALDAVKIGQATKVVVMRDGERLELTMTPRTRD